MIDPVTETLRDMIRRLVEEPFSVSVRETPTEQLRKMLRELNPLGALDGAAQGKIATIEAELANRQGESSI